MRLKKIAIFGFKSFADKTVLTFDSGITCIVGPNGCGKSNISDSFRWVLGEQSAKSMRGSKMPDVIFAGTQSRHPSNFAEVSLTLTDIQNGLSIDYEEITITRRLYRDGDSEYLLNGNQVRLKDLQNLFLDSGVGKNAFSIFEQGKLDQVISFSPIERRYIFEEAAGILRFLQRKKETAKRLELADINLNRVNDTFREIESQVVHLEKQAVKAREYKENAHSLEILEKTSCIVKWQSLDKKKRELVEKQQAHQQQLVDSIAQEKNDQQKCIVADQSLQAHESETKKAYAELLGLQNQYELEQKEVSNLEQRASDVHKRISKLKNSIEELALNRSSRVTSIKQLEKKSQLLDSEWNVSESTWTSYKEQVSLREFKVNELRSQVNDKNRLYLESVQQCNQHQNHLKQTEIRLENQLERQQALEKKLELLKSQQKGVEEDIQKRRQDLQHFSDIIDAHSDRLENFTEQLEIINRDQEQYRGKIDINRHQLAECRARHKILIQMREDLEGFSVGSKRLLKENSLTNSSLFQKLTPLCNFFTSANNNADAVVAIMRAYAQTLVVDTIEDYKAVIQFAERENLSDYSIICLEFIKKIHQKNVAPSELLSAHFLNGVTFSKDSNQLFLQFQTAQSENVWINEGNFIDHKGVFFKIKSNQNHVFAREAELKKLEEELCHLEDDFNNQEKKLNELQSQRTQIQLERAEVDKMHRRDEMKLVEINVGLQKAISDQEKKCIDEKNSQEEAKILNVDFKHLQTTLSDISKEHKTAHLIVEQLRNEKLTLEKLLFAEDEQLKKDQKNQQDTQSIYHQLLETRQNLLHQKNVLEVQEANDQTQLLRMEEELEESRELQIELLDRQKKSNQTLVEQNEKLIEVKKSYDLLEQQKSAFSQAVKTANDQLRLSHDQVRAFEEQINQMQIVKAQLENGMETIERELDERYQLTVENALKLDLQFDLSIDKIERQIRKYRQALQEIGDVNLTAIEELEKHQVRRQFISQQVADMQSSKVELLEIIARLASESRSLFKQTFEAIRANFRKNFEILFEGGEADLQLTDSPDILEAGIEISAKPPGKQMRSISLLSGGEKCLTAVALMFAIFEVKPAPFCILDEIDAPLDDSNVDRFVNVVKHFVNQCQFLIITHNKRTMAIGDTLFGVSMEERGVTKLLALEFSNNQIPEASLV